jgi:hypothetical protein
MTNIVATVVVAVSTNISVSEFRLQPALYGCLVYGCTQDHWKEANKEADSKRTRATTTTAVETTTVKFDRIVPREVKSERVLWSTSVVERLEWKR